MRWFDLFRKLRRSIFSRQTARAQRARRGHPLRLEVLEDRTVPSFPGSNGLLAFQALRGGNLEIHVMQGDGTGRTPLTSNTAADFAPAWSPDGNRLAFVSNRDGNHEIYVMNADGSGQLRLTNNTAQDGNPSWSPDGTRIVFESDRDGDSEIFVMNADGSGQTPLTNDPAADTDPVWSPLGNRIAFVRVGSIWFMNPDGGSQSLFTEGSDPDWSPDGGRLVFRSFRETTLQVEGPTSDIFTISVSGTDVRRLTNHSYPRTPTWSADGSKIAFEDGTGVGGPPRVILVVNPDGTGTHGISGPASQFDLSPNWGPLGGPGGGRIVPRIATPVAGDEQLFGLDPAGQVWRFDVGDDEWSALGATGVQIVVSSTGDGDPDNDIVFLRASDSAIWMWHDGDWSFTGGWLPGLVPGDEQFFAVGFDGQVYQFHVDDGWTQSGVFGISLDVGSDGDEDDENDIVYLIAADHRLWTWDQHTWSFSGGWLPGVVAGDDQAFAIGFDGQVWRYQVRGPHVGWTASAGWGATLALGNLGDGNPINDVVFLQGGDGAVWTWDQSRWEFTGGWLKSFVGADNLLFGIGQDDQLWRYRVGFAGARWTATSGYGVAIVVANVGDQDSKDIVFLQAADGTMWTWDQRSWTVTGR